MTEPNHSYKIAVATTDGVTVNFHLGRTPFFEVFSIDAGSIVHRERRENPGSRRPLDRGMDGNITEHQLAPHHMLTLTISDCKVVISRGMGKNAYRILTDLGIQAILTDIRLIEMAVEQAMKGSLKHHHHRVH